MRVKFQEAAFPESLGMAAARIQVAKVAVSLTVVRLVVTSIPGVLVINSAQESQNDFNYRVSRSRWWSFVGAKRES